MKEDLRLKRNIFLPENARRRWDGLWTAVTNELRKRATMFCSRFNETS